MERRFKFKHFETYSSDEWMANNTKKFRTCFDEAELDFVRCELALFNKLFDEEDWEAELKLIITDKSEKKEYCKIKEKIKVSKNDNIFYHRDGWGYPEKGVSWKKGEYKWKVYIDGILIHEHYFYVNKVGLVTPAFNPYFDVISLRIYEADKYGRNPDGKYLKTISKKETRYLWLEFRFKVKTKEDFFYEFYFNYFDDSGQPKAQIRHQGFVDKNKDTYEYKITRGWGSEKPGTWLDDQYTLEVVFNDCRIGGITFYASDTAEEGVPDPLEAVSVNTRKSSEQSPQQNKVADTETLEDVLAQLENLVGLQQLKSDIKEHITYLKFLQIRKEKGIETDVKLNLHTVFTGNPGTGKTTVARMLGKIYHKMGLLRSPEVLEVGRADLVGEFIGQTAPKTKEVIDKSRGGILFIDEAYSLSRPGEDNKDFGREAIEVLLKEMTDGKGDFTLVAAGYPKEMEHFLNSNPGLKSRFGKHFHFEDYTPEELLQIGLNEAEKLHLQPDDEFKSLLTEKLIEAYRNRDRSFGNARMVCGWIHGAKMNMGVRVMNEKKQEELTEEDFRVLKKSDLEKLFVLQKSKVVHLKINEKDLQLALEELNALTGLQSLKNDIHEMIKLVRFYNESGKDVTGRFSMHAVFAGNPGTGKTTVARILAKIYKAMGLLERGHCVEVDREALVAGYVGQTAIKTAEVVEKAMGGVLFIDEAYTLNGQGQNDFGKEAIETILKRMEDHRGKFAVIAAGYTGNMEEFLKMNPGLASRFDRTLYFEDYKPEELLKIAKNILSREGLMFHEDAEKSFFELLKSAWERRDKYFGNARLVRKLCDIIIKNQHLRMSEIPKEERTPEMLKTIITDDLKNTDFLEKYTFARPGIGFRLNV
ncbi:MAG: AAA family ATPase [Bacteroidia bacterium]|nr:AAA family ATPase [Bacteroidia bacterium]